MYQCRPGLLSREVADETWRRTHRQLQVLWLFIASLTAVRETNAGEGDLGSGWRRRLFPLVNGVSGSGGAACFTS